MCAAVTALSWELLARSRWLLVLTGCWLVLLCLAALALPASLRIPEVGWGLVVSLAFPLIFVLGSLSHGEGRLESAASLFPGRFFTLPVPAVVLVGPPLLLVTVVVVVCWTLCAVFLLRACGANAPLWWPGLFCAGTLALLQAFTWSPFPLPWLRLAGLAVFWVGVLVGLILLVEQHDKISEPALVLTSVVLLLAGYAGSLAGVTRARRGEGRRAPFQVGPVAVGAFQNAPQPFSSPLRAQVWLEGKRLGWARLIVALLCAGVSVALMFVIDGAVRRRERSLFPGGTAVASPAAGSSRPLLAGDGLPADPSLPDPLRDGCCGTGTHADEPHGPICSAFLATRPIRTTEMVKAKLLICAAVVVGLWGVTWLGGLGWVVCMGRVGEMADRLVLLTGSGLAAVLALMGALVLLAVISWLALIQNLWVGALGRPLAGMVPLVLAPAFPIVVVLLLANWREAWWTVLGWAVGVALVGKALAVGWVVWRLRREQLVADRTLGCTIAGWVLLAAVVESVALVVFSGGFLLVGGAVLLLPLARPLAAPLALRTTGRANGGSKSWGR